MAQQLRSEVESLQEYISHAEERVLGEHWSQALLGPLEEASDSLEEEDLIEALTALVTARDRFGLEGSFAERLDQVLQRYPQHLGEIIARQPKESETVSYDFTPQGPAPSTAHSLFEEEDEEVAPDEVSLDEEPEAPQAPEEPAPSGEDLNLAEEVADDLALNLFSPTPLSEPEDEEDEPGDAPNGFTPLQVQDYPEAQATEAGLDTAPPPADPFEVDEDEFVEETALFKPVDFGQKPASPTEDSPALADQKAESPASENVFTESSAPGPSPDELFNEAAGGILADEESPAEADRIEARRRKNRRTQRRPARLGAAAPTNTTVNPLANKVSLDDLQQKMGFTLTRQDIQRLQLSLHEQVNGRKLNALKTDPEAEGRYLLVPRVSRFFYEGKLLDCTVKNLAKVFFSAFGSIQDLTQYKGAPFINNETPQTTWALITPEAMPGSMGKNYMDQQQFMRQLSGRISLPSHLVRRRTLVEAIYDLLVGSRVLDSPQLKQTLDWTSTGPTKNDFVCIYQAEEGIRIRDLTRTSHHRVLGLCPNW